MFLHRLDTFSVGLIAFCFTLKTKSGPTGKNIILRKSKFILSNSIECMHDAPISRLNHLVIEKVAAVMDNRRKGVKMGPL